MSNYVYCECHGPHIGKHPSCDAPKSLLTLDDGLHIGEDRSPGYYDTNWKSVPEPPTVKSLPVSMKFPCMTCKTDTHLKCYFCNAPCCKPHSNIVNTKTGPSGKRGTYIRRAGRCCVARLADQFRSVKAG